MSHTTSRDVLQENLNGYWLCGIHTNDVELFKCVCYDIPFQENENLCGIYISFTGCKVASCWVEYNVKGGSCDCILILFILVLCGWPYSCVRNCRYMAASWC